jgi:putative DNA primase/helicase
VSDGFEKFDPPRLSLAPARHRRQLIEYLNRVLAAQARHLNESPPVLVCGGRLVSVEEESGRVLPHTVETLRATMGNYAGIDRRIIDDLEAEPLRAVLTLGSWPELPVLRRVTHVPLMFDADGSLEYAADLDHFDWRTGTWCLSSTVVVEAAYLGDELSVEQAKHLLLEELLGEFPFVGESDRAHALALVLTPFLRVLIDGPAPLFVVDAPRHRTGKSLLVEASLTAAEGERARPSRLPANEDTVERMIAAALGDGATSMWLDNVRHYVDSETLAMVLTSRRWSRPSVRYGAEPLNNLATWVLTQNAAGLSTELTKRAVLIRLDAGTEHPERRQIRRQQPLVSWALEHRAELLAAAFRICEAWNEAGRPIRRERRMGGFESWEQVLGGVLQAVGVPGFLGNVDVRDETVDVEEADLRALVLSIVENVGVDVPRTAAELVEDARTWDEDPSRLGSRTPKSAGKLLNKALNKPTHGYVLRRELRRSAANGWYVASLGSST